MNLTAMDIPAAPKPLPAQVLREATISQCDQYRWTLSRTWRAGPHVCFCGLNPSTADHVTDDPTVRRWMHFAHSWGYGGFVAVNLYPFRTPQVAACKRWANWENNGPDWYARDRHWENERVVAAEARRADKFVACWGASAWDDAYIDHVLDQVREEEPFSSIYCLGTTADGSPKHPMARGRHRIPNDVQPMIWREGA